ncbi:DNA-binding domain-containing protein [Gilvimarinus chinensis]|uniref:HvfC family RiPP maturation protein n=1 Tax=Gilvimarinus chinensis TaxID=396005 RepID=UPI00036E849F|nr:putative DNA-binding domain-containing protein [Gilvimarinus chinensis]
MSEIQKRFADHLRDPAVCAAPEGIEERRLNIYRGLIYNNIEGFISGGFPVLREILAAEHWHEMVRDFIVRHQSLSPYFLEISQEFLTYLQNEREPDPRDPPFMQELAHYEWVELALDVAEQELPSAEACDDLLSESIQVSPLLWCLSYQYPVHRLGPEYQPQIPPAQPTFILVYRNRADRVEFMLSNAATIHFIKLLQGGSGTARELLHQWAADMGNTTMAGLTGFAESLLLDLQSRDILWAKR